MATREFKFIETYRKLAPTANRELIDARQKDHERLYPLFAKSMESVYVTCRLAFHLTQDSPAMPEWFEKTIREFDPHFSIEIDKAEGGHIASLLLRDLMSRGSPQAALAILVCSYCGRRMPLDGELVVVARDTIANAARARRIVLAERKIALAPEKDLKPRFDAIEQNWQQDTVRAAFDAIVADYRDATAKTASSATDAHQSLRDDVIRLAEEVDMLWWHIGDWSETLDRPRSELPQQAVGIVSGVELGNFVRQVPGPYGAYGILRRTLGETSDRRSTLKDAIASLGQDAKALACELPQSAMPVFPVHAAVRMAADRGQESWTATFDQAVGDVKDFDSTYFELAVQTFRERVMIKDGGLGR